MSRDTNKDTDGAKARLHDGATSSSISPMRLLAIWPIVKAAGLVPMTIVFVVIFTLSSVAISFAEPEIHGFVDAAWFLFTVTTTIGLGDFTCATTIGRLITVLLSVYSVFYLALVTGAVVSYCGERMKARRNESVAAFLDQLERLPELSHEELVELSNKVKRL